MPADEFKSLSDRYPRLRRLAVLVLVAGGLAAYSFVKPFIPHEHPVLFKFDPDSRAVSEFEATWTRAESPNDAVAGSRFRFDPSTAPRELKTTVRASDGDYVVEYSVVAGNRRQTERQGVRLGESVARVLVLVPEIASAASSAAPTGSGASSR